MSGIPIVAISMDERLDGIMKELSFEKNYLYHASDSDLAEKLYVAMEKAEENRQKISRHILTQRLEYQKRLREMGDFLKTYISDVGDSPFKRAER